ncbi:hypothetical protein [Aquisphaera insulae]|uniref:hypothetical protein n=1 Tax=Aquisphaera insulae TaxID=2712864 RepID=UPI0013E9D31D|nr:hypothetical protein [Aquisphaera insulae]
MPPEVSEPRPTFLDAFSPLDTTFTAALTFLLSHLILVPACSPVRLGDEGWAWLDAYRVSPSQSGWLAYGTYGLAVASLLGALLGAAHRLALKTVRSDRVRYLLGLSFMLVAAVVCFLLPLFLHRVSRLPTRPTAAATRTGTAAAAFLMPGGLPAAPSVPRRSEA